MNKMNKITCYLILLLLHINQGLSQKYYYKEYRNQYDIYYGPSPIGDYKELKSPKSYKIRHNNRGDRPGGCSKNWFWCVDKPYPVNQTKIFECSADYQCPQFYKCCQLKCFHHKVCQPSTSKLEGKSSSSTITLSFEDEITSTMSNKVISQNLVSVIPGVNYTTEILSSRGPNPTLILTTIVRNTDISELSSRFPMLSTSKRPDIVLTASTNDGDRKENGTLSGSANEVLTAVTTPPSVASTGTKKSQAVSLESVTTSVQENYTSNNTINFFNPRESSPMTIILPTSFPEDRHEFTKNLRENETPFRTVRIIDFKVNMTGKENVTSGIISSIMPNVNITENLMNTNLAFSNMTENSFYDIYGNYDDVEFEQSGDDDSQTKSEESDNFSTVDISPLNNKKNASSKTHMLETTISDIVDNEDDNDYDDEFEVSGDGGFEHIRVGSNVMTATTRISLESEINHTSTTKTQVSTFLMSTVENTLDFSEQTTYSSDTPNKIFSETLDDSDSSQFKSLTTQSIVSATLHNIKEKASAAHASNIDFTGNDENGDEDDRYEHSGKAEFDAIITNENVRTDNTVPSYYGPSIPDFSGKHDGDSADKFQESGDGDLETDYEFSIFTIHTGLGKEREKLSTLNGQYKNTEEDDGFHFSEDKAPLITSDNSNMKIMVTAYTPSQDKIGVHSNRNKVTTNSVGEKAGASTKSIAYKITTEVIYHDTEDYATNFERNTYYNSDIKTDDNEEYSGDQNFGNDDDDYESYMLRSSGHDALEVHSNTNTFSSKIATTTTKRDTDDQERKSTLRHSNNNSGTKEPHSRITRTVEKQKTNKENESSFVHLFITSPVARNDKKDDDKYQSREVNVTMNSEKYVHNDIDISEDILIANTRTTQVKNPDIADETSLDAQILPPKKNIGYKEWNDGEQVELLPNREVDKNIPKMDLAFTSPLSTLEGAVLHNEFVELVEVYAELDGTMTLIPKHFRETERKSGSSSTTSHFEGLKNKVFGVLSKDNEELSRNDYKKFALTTVSPDILDVDYYHKDFKETDYQPEDDDDRGDFNGSGNDDADFESSGDDNGG